MKPKTGYAEAEAGKSLLVAGVSPAAGRHLEIEEQQPLQKVADAKAIVKKIRDAARIRVGRVNGTTRIFP